MKCAKMILNHHGFKAWPKFETSCKGNLVHPWVVDVKKCLHSSYEPVGQTPNRLPSPSRHTPTFGFTYPAAPKARSIRL